MGMDGVFVCMAKDYYCPADNSKAFWLKKEKLDELCEKASALDPLLIGKMAPRIVLADTSEKNGLIFINFEINTTYSSFGTLTVDIVKKKFLLLSKIMTNG